MLLGYCQTALSEIKFERGDYRKLCEMIVVFLGAEVEYIRFAQPGAHQARFMADAKYLLTIQMTSKQINTMEEQES